MADRETKRLLIWGETYPELSEKYRETVCTAGVDEAGHPIRLYPLPIRYMQAHQEFKLYDWVTVSIRNGARRQPPTRV